MALPLARPRLLLADKGYDGDAVREGLLVHGILPVIPPRANRSRPIACDYRRYKGSLCIKVRNATQSLGRGADQAAAREGRSPNEQDSFSSEKSYSPKRLTWAHESME